jgi:hypothetical protein
MDAMKKAWNFLKYVGTQPSRSIGVGGGTKLSEDVGSVNWDRELTDIGLKPIKVKTPKRQEDKKLLSNEMNALDSDGNYRKTPEEIVPQPPQMGQMQNIDPVKLAQMRAARDAARVQLGQTNANRGGDVNPI